MADGKKRFIKKYNELFNVPNDSATISMCEKYEKDHSSDFRNSGWSIDKHRKKFMDWISTKNK